MRKSQAAQGYLEDTEQQVCTWYSKPDLLGYKHTLLSNTKNPTAVSECAVTVWNKGSIEAHESLKKFTLFLKSAYANYHAAAKLPSLLRRCLQ